MSEHSVPERVPFRYTVLRAVLRGGPRRIPEHRGGALLLFTPPTTAGRLVIDVHLDDARLPHSTRADLDTVHAALDGIRAVCEAVPNPGGRRVNGSAGRPPHAAPSSNPGRCTPASLVTCSAPDRLMTRLVR